MYKYFWVSKYNESFLLNTTSFLFISCLWPTLLSGHQYPQDSNPLASTMSLNPRFGESYHVIEGAFRYSEWCTIATFSSKLFSHLSIEEEWKLVFRFQTPYLQFCGLHRNRVHRRISIRISHYSNLIWKFKNHQSCLWFERLRQPSDILSRY